LPDEQKEIIRYEFQADIRDLEEKAKRAHALASETGDTAGFKAWRQRERTETALNRPYDEAQRRADQDAFETWRTAARAEEEQLKSTSSATETLIQHKRGLVNIIGLLGGSFGGLAGHLIGLVALITSAGAAMAGWIAAAAGATLLVTLFQNIAAAAKAAADEQDRLNQGVTKQQAAKRIPAGRIDETLAGFGQATPEQAKGAMALYNAVKREYGLDEPELATVGMLGGATTAEEIAVLKQMQRPAKTQGGEMKLEKPEQVQAALAAARESGAYGVYAGEAGALARLPETRTSPEQQLFEDLQGEGILPPGVTNVGQLKAGLERLREARAAGPPAQRNVIQPGHRIVSAAELLGGTSDELAEQARVWQPIEARLSDVRQGRVQHPQAGQGGVSPESALPDPITQFLERTQGWSFSPQAVAERTVVNIVNQGTVYNDRDGPSRQREQRSHFNLDGVDIKARY